MKAYVVRRLAAFIPSLFVISLMVFLLIHFVPGDPAILILGNEATPEGIASLRSEMGLDQPLHVQMAWWYRNALQGDLGRSFYLDRSVVQAIWERLPLTLALTAGGLLVAVALGLPAGILAAVRQNTWLDAVIMSASVLGLSIPSFVLGLLLIYYVAVPIDAFPTGGFVRFSESWWDALRHLLLPALSLGLAQASFVARMSRASMLEVLRLDYVRTAHAKGVSHRGTVLRHALSNALIPVITVIGLITGILLGGAIVTETVFGLPGIGRLIISAVQRRDYPVIQGVILFVTFAYLAVNLLTDLTYIWVNPRLRHA